MVVKVYGAAYAACPQRVMHYLMELSVPFELVHVDLDAMEHKLPEFLEKQPFGQLSYISDDDFELFESRAIVRYLATKYASDDRPSLLGRMTEERAKVEQWMDVDAINYNPWASAGTRRRQQPPWRSWIGAEVYEKHLEKTRYLAGDKFKLADLTHIPSIRCLVEKWALRISSETRSTSALGGRTSLAAARRRRS